MTSESTVEDLARLELVKGSGTGGATSSHQGTTRFLGSNPLFRDT